MILLLCLQAFYNSNIILTKFVSYYSQYYAGIIGSGLIKKLQWFEYLKVVFLEILNTLLVLCQVFANQVTYYMQLL